MNSLYLLSGPTASGKTSLAVEWARAQGAEILSCDAFLLYEGMDIGTAKPTQEERGGISHHGIDLVPVHEAYDVARYASYARAVVEDCAKREVPLLVVGGSGFYLKSFFEAVTDQLEIPERVRAVVGGLEAEGGLSAMLERLRELNPEGLGNLDTANPRRVRPALERCLASGLTVLELRAQLAARPDPYEGFERELVVLSRSRERLAERITARTRAMLNAGLIEEVRQLRERGLERNVTAAAAIGYAQTLRWLDTGERGTESLAEAINTATRQLVRRQESWLRNQLPQARWMDLESRPVQASALFTRRRE